MSEPAKQPIPRIGRQPNPAERGYQHVVENVDVLDHASRNYYGSEHNLIGIKLAAAWARLSDAEREMWKERAIAALRQYVANYPESR